MKGWIALSGYMAAGKSTVGRRLAEMLGTPFVDTDAAIEAKAGLEIPKIFTDKGELWFRRTEERVIRDLLAGEPGVMALGGGALTSERTKGLLSRQARVVWLRLDPRVAWERASGTGRPLATDQDRFVRRYESREPGYRDAADLTVDASLPVSDVVHEIVAWASPPMTAGSAK